MRIRIKMLYGLLLFVLVFSIVGSAIIQYTGYNENIQIVNQVNNMATSNVIASNAIDTEKYIKQITFIERNPNTIMDEYAYLAAVPNSIIYDSDGIKYISPILYGMSDIEQYYLEDWASYLNGWPGTTIIHLVGDYSPDFKSNVLSYFEESSYREYSSSDAIQFAKDIAISNWINSSYAVLAPIDASLGEHTYSGSFTGNFSDISYDKYVSRLVTYDYNVLYFSSPYFAESPHPYSNNMNQTYTIHVNGAVALTLHFEKIDVEENFDYVRVYDGQWNLIAEYTGYYEDVWTPKIIGNVAYIELCTDSSVTAWGFVVDYLIYSKPPMLISDGDSFSYDFYVDSNVNYVLAYIYTNETSSTNSLIGVYLKDASGRVVDYSIVPGSERSSRSVDVSYFDIGYNDRLFWLNNIEGYYTITFKAINIPDDCSITVFSEIYLYNATDRYTIDVPEDAIELSVSLDISNSDYYNYARIGLIDPYGNWIFGNIFESESFIDRHITVPYPVKGKWTIVVYCNPSEFLEGKSTYYKVNYLIKTKSYNTEAMESAANAAVYASLKNAPLLYIKLNEIPDETLEALSILNVKNIYLFDPYNLVSNGIVNYLEDLGYSVIEITSRSSLVSIIRQSSNTDKLVISLGDNGLFAPATLLAAYHGCPIILFENNNGKLIINLDKAVWGRFWYSEYFEGFYGLIEDWRYAHLYWMNRLSNEFFNWIYRYGLHASDVSYVTVIAPTSKVPALLERAILGGVFPGRLPARDQVEASAMISRTITYNAVIFENPGKNRITESLIAYHVGWWIVDNDGVTRTVDDYKITETTDYEMQFHIGEDEILSALNEGTLVWYYADHGDLGYNIWNHVPGGPGTLTVTYNDFSWRAYETDGNGTVPDTNGDGIVNPTDILVRKIWGTELDLRLKNLHSTLAIFMACLVGSSEIPEIILRHGGIASFANLRTLYFGYGYVTATFLNYLYLGKTFGEAYFESVNATSYNYFKGTVSYVIGYYDSVLESYGFIRYPLFGGVSVQYVLFGDPSVKLLSATASEPEPVSPSDLTVESHTLSGNIKRSINLRITAPQKGVFVNDSFIVKWDVSVNFTILKNITLHINGMSYDVTGKTSYLVDITPMDDGNYTIEVIAFDVIGNIASDSIWIVVDKTAPQISIISPYDHQNVSGVVYILWSVQDEHLKSVMLKINDTIINITDKGYYMWNTTEYSNGIYIITIIAEDQVGNFASETIQVSVANLQVIEPHEPQESMERPETTKFNITLIGAWMSVGFILGFLLALLVHKLRK
ncbi:MAG: hypothetical protein J7L07_04395 [Candidatus Odinarchaeota archaeon]|nr:hypothetical protein [Candidatus Odinarchaeota archaeon]